MNDTDRTADQLRESAARDLRAEELAREAERESAALDQRAEELAREAEPDERHERDDAGRHRPDCSACS